MPKRRDVKAPDKIDINMTPMIDVVFQLMAFFLMTFKVAATEGDFNLKLPKADRSQGAANTQTEMLTVGLRTTANGQLAIAPDNALRYRPYLVAMEGVEARRLVAAYVRLYPLFQKAYEELGYPNAYFNDRLIQAIDDMLATPEGAIPTLVQPKVLYQFANPSLEDRSAGQKILLRMGPDNAARVKDKLRAIRKEIVAQAPQS